MVEGLAANFKLRWLKDVSLGEKGPSFELTMWISQDVPRPCQAIRDAHRFAANHSRSPSLLHLV
jgi:hypothetical protein